jgi:hypothetical protein
MASGTASVSVTNWLLSSVGLTATVLLSSLLQQMNTHAALIKISMTATTNSLILLIEYNVFVRLLISNLQFGGQRYGKKSYFCYFFE